MFGKDATDNQITEFDLFSGTGSLSNRIKNSQISQFYCYTLCLLVFVY